MTKALMLFMILIQAGCAEPYTIVHSQTGQPIMLGRRASTYEGCLSIMHEEAARLGVSIKGFFDTVSHAWMLKFLGVRIVDPSFLLLIERFLKAGYMDSDLLVATERGTPQGGNLSPVLSNIFLHYVLDLWFTKRIRDRVRGVCFLIRYADDFVILVQYLEDALYLVKALRERFTQFDLELHPEKTRVLSFGRYERENAKRQGRRAHTFDFLGFTHYCGRSRRGKFIVGRRTSRKKFRKKYREGRLPSIVAPPVLSVSVTPVVAYASASPIDLKLKVPEVTLMSAP